MAGAGVGADTGELGKIAREYGGLVWARENVSSLYVAWLWSTTQQSDVQRTRRRGDGGAGIGIGIGVSVSKPVSEGRKWTAFPVENIRYDRSVM